MKVSEYTMSVGDGIVFLVLFLVLFLSTGRQTQWQPNEMTRNSAKDPLRIYYSRVRLSRRDLNRHHRQHVIC